MSCSSMTCRNYDSTCDGGRILVIVVKFNDNAPPTYYIYIIIDGAVFHIKKLLITGDNYVV